MASPEAFISTHPHIFNLLPVIAIFPLSTYLKNLIFLTMAILSPILRSRYFILREAPILKVLLTFILLLTLLPASAVKKIEANPINIAYMLAQDTDSVSMAKTCEYYGYISQPSQDGYTVFTHRNGSIIRYSFKDASHNQPYPVVEVKSKQSSKDIDKTLIDLHFKKEGPGYIRNQGQYARSIFICKNGSQGFMVFHQKRLLRQD